MGLDPKIMKIGQEMAKLWPKLEKMQKRTKNVHVHEKDARARARAKITIAHSSKLRGGYVPVLIDG